MTRGWLMAALFGSILLSALAQLLLKMGMSSAAVQGAIADPAVSLPRTMLAVAFSPFVLLGLACFLASVVTWLLVLSKLDLSTAYPFVALGVVLTVVAGVVLLGESLSAGKLTGIAMVLAGVTVLGISATAE